MFKYSVLRIQHHADLQLQTTQNYIVHSEFLIQPTTKYMLGYSLLESPPCPITLNFFCKCKIDFSSTPYVGGETIAVSLTDDGPEYVFCILSNLSWSCVSRLQLM